MRYILLNLITEKFIKLESYGKLIEYISIYGNSYNYFGSTWGDNTILNSIALNKNDLTCCGGPHREYMVIDQYDRVIDPRDFKEDVYKSRTSYVTIWNRRRRYLNINVSIFRYDPIVGISKKYGFRYYRHPKSRCNIRKMCAPEQWEYNRRKDALPLRDTLVEWDYNYRSRGTFGKSWKNMKIKRQWMKHLK